MTDLVDLFELEVSENAGIQVDKLLQYIQTCSNMESLQTLMAAQCSVSPAPQPIDSTLGGEKLHLLSRLDVSGSLREPEQLIFLTESPALSTLNYLNLSQCSIDEGSLQKVFDSENLRNLEVLGLAKVVNRAAPMFVLPTETRYGLDHKIRVIDLRYNDRVNISLIKRKPYLNKVVIFAW